MDAHPDPAPGQPDATARPTPALGGAGGPLVVLGIGNILLCDDGVGVAVVRELREQTVDVAHPGGPGLPANTEIIEGGTAGLALLPLIGGARALLIVDAVDLDAPPGTVHVLIGERVGDAYRGHLSAHQVGASDLIAAARLTGMLPAAFVLVGVQPASLDTGVGLSPAVTAALPEALETVRLWCRRLDAYHTTALDRPTPAAASAARLVSD